MEPYDFVRDAIRQAGELLLLRRDEGFRSMNKGGDPRDIVTSVDHEVNAFLVHSISTAYPGDAIYSEEHMEDDAVQTGRMWTIDPIDGTANFSRGIPHYAVCLGLLEDGIPIVGAIDNPVTKELFSFEKGKGAYLNGTPIHVSDITQLQKANVFFHAGRKDELREWGGRSYERLLAHARKTGNFGSSSLDACFVAAGRIEANVYGTLSTLDMAPALGLLVEAGGVMCDDAGAPIGTFSREPKKIYMANNTALLTEIRDLLEL